MCDFKKIEDTLESCNINDLHTVDRLSSIISPEYIINVAAVYPWTGTIFSFIVIVILYVGKLAIKANKLDQQWITIVNWIIFLVVVFFLEKVIEIGNHYSDNYFLTVEFFNITQASILAVIVIKLHEINYKKISMLYKAATYVIAISFGASIISIIIILSPPNEVLPLGDTSKKIIAIISSSIHYPLRIMFVIYLASFWYKEKIFFLAALTPALLLTVIFLHLDQEIRGTNSIIVGWGTDIQFMMSRIFGLFYIFVFFTILFMPFFRMQKEQEKIVEKSYKYLLSCNSLYTIKWKGNPVKIQKKPFILLLELMKIAQSDNQKCMDVNNGRLHGRIVDYPDISRLRALLQKNYIDLKIKIHPEKQACYYLDIKKEDIYIANGL